MQNHCGSLVIKYELSCGTVALYDPFNIIFLADLKKKRTIKGYGSAANMNYAP